VNGTVERIERANPVPRVALSEDEFVDSAALYSAIVARRDSTAPAHTEKPKVAAAAPSPWYRRPAVVALSAAVVVVIAIGAGALLFGGTDTPAGSPSPPITEPAPSTTDATTDVGSLPFDFATDDPCQWFTPEEINEIVTDAYIAHGVAPPDHSVLDCEPWPDDFDTLTNLEVLNPLESWMRGSEDPEGYTTDPLASEPVAGLDPAIRVRNLSQGCVAYTVGVNAELLVDGHVEILTFTHLNLTDGDAGISSNRCDAEAINPIGLTVAESMLRRLGWIE